MRDPAQRARILHALANHELQAIELFAWALLDQLPEALQLVGGLFILAGVVLVKLGEPAARADEGSVPAPTG